MANSQEKTKQQLETEIAKLQEKTSSLEEAIVELKLNAESLRRNELNLVSLLRSMDDLLFVIGLDGSFNRYYQSPTRFDLFLPPKEFLGKHFRDVLPSDVADQLQKAINAVEAYGKTQEFDFFIPIKQREYWFNAKLSLFKPVSGDYFGYLCELRSVTERKKLEDALRESVEKYRAVMQQNTMCILLTDIDTRVIVDANLAMQKLLGYSEDELTGLSLYDFMEQEQEDIYQKILEILKERSYFLGERKFRRKDGSFVEVEISVNLISYREKKVFCVIARDITPRKLAEKQLIHTATHDPLTGLVNRLLVYDRLAQELARARRHDKMIALIYIDLDRFKEINDTMGHGVGDQLLKAVGARIKSLLRDSDTLARMGGDEYMIILPEISHAKDVDRVVANLMDALRRPFDLEGIKHHITVSVGVSFYPLDGKDSETLIKTADVAMYFAKSAGRNACRRYSSEMKVKDLTL
jgi:diguanylate cyclase (GGDEF)-like protein/PAS domain S-box-containing protein